MLSEVNPSLYWKRLLPLYDEREARAVVRYLLEEKFGLSLTDIYSGGVDRLNSAQRDDLESCMVRLGEGEPVQYVVGAAWFCGRRFRVAPGVLIPRPETETLAKEVTGWLHSLPTGLKPHRVLDVGTGSGCIAVTVALECKHTQVTAWDLSDAALTIAIDNARLLGADKKVTFVRQDALNPPHDHRVYDAIVSNPPYVCERERKDMAPNVLHHEPSEALFVPDDDPLRFYEAIASYACEALNVGALLAFEVNSAFAEQVRELLNGKGFVDTFIHDDPFDRPRIVAGFAPK
jgi:release factor glutamine methyltransferase